MNVTREQVLEGLSRIYKTMGEHGIRPAVQLRLDETLTVGALEAAGFLLGKEALKALDDDLVAAVDAHGDVVALMTQETYDALKAAPAGFYQPRIYASGPSSIMRKPQPPFWANDWRRGRKGRGR